MSTRFTPLPAKMARRLGRARSAVGHRTLYELGHGGNDPSAPTPAEGGVCDCSGFALAWVQEISRNQSDKHKDWSAHIPWVNTDAVVHDATHGQELFVRLDAPVVGCAMVYGKSDTEDYGHCAIVTGFAMAIDAPTVRGIDCHGGWGGHHTEAIQEHDLSYFLAKGCIFVALKEDTAEGA